MHCAEVRWDLVKKHCNLFPGKWGLRYFHKFSAVLILTRENSLLSYFVRYVREDIAFLMLMQDVNDVLTAIDYVIDKGLANPSKIAVLGGSHGGFLTTHLIGQVE